ncbi:uncharacterized protein L203_104159 [Cryptococcus depauperatus CBS 7841]|uniref:Uncharacterized protein n=1 Tax=Cryptococcus depauperatus CBS 7841 TaxID=1295531 RepID=A0AAJ8JV11_9TREE
MKHQRSAFRKTALLWPLPSTSCSALNNRATVETFLSSKYPAEKDYQTVIGICNSFEPGDDPLNNSVSELRKDIDSVHAKWEEASEYCRLVEHYESDREQLEKTGRVRGGVYQHYLESDYAPSQDQRPESQSSTVFTRSCQAVRDGIGGLMQAGGWSASGASSCR